MIDEGEDGEAPAPDEPERQRWFTESKRFTSGVLGSEGDTLTLVPAGDLYIGRSIYISGSWDAEQMDALIDRATSHLGRSPIRGRTFVDVGANIGSTTMRALLVHGADRSIALEPHPRLARFLRANVALNGLDGRVRVVEAGASDRPGRSRLDLASANHGDHHLVGVGDQAPSPVADHPGDYVDIDVKTLDEVVGRRVRPGMLWIDTQGHDARVMAGGRRTAGRSDCCVAEYWPLGLSRQPGGLGAFETVMGDVWRYFVDVEDVMQGRGALRPTDTLRDLRNHYDLDGAHTDLLLLR